MSQLVTHQHAGNISRVRAALVKAFQDSHSSNRCLLFGYAGAGKSSLVDSALQEVAGDGQKTVDIVEFNCTAIVNGPLGAGGALNALIRLRERFMQNLPDLRVFVFDEADAIGPHRDRADSAGQGLCYFCMDCLNNGSASVFWLLITNYPEMLDSAILSRVGRRLYLPCPDRDAARMIVGNWLDDPGEIDQVLNELFSADAQDVPTTRGLAQSLTQLANQGAFQNRRINQAPGTLANYIRGLAGFPGRIQVQEWEGLRRGFIRNSDSLLTLWGI